MDPTQRETILSLGAFLQNLAAAAHLGYACHWQLLADNNQADSVMDVALAKVAGLPAVDIAGLLRRRTVRTGYRNQPLALADVRALTAGEPGYHFFRRDSP